MSEPKAKVYTEYRVLSSRVGNGVTDKRYGSLKAVADRIGRLTSPEPWRFYGSASQRLRGPNDLACCAGTYHDECSCGGYTIQQKSDEERRILPALEWVRVEVRTVVRSPWVAVGEKPLSVPAGATASVKGATESAQSLSSSSGVLAPEKDHR